jgi:hypothetical protein
LTGGQRRQKTREEVMPRIIVALGWAFGMLVLASTGISAQSYPTKPIRVIVPFSAGSGTDIVARVVMEQVSQQLGQPIVVENRVGAGGVLGIGAVAKADPDGYTLLIQSTSFAVVASTYSNPGYDSRKDFAGITALVSLPNVLVVQPNKYKALKDLVDAAKASPGKMNYASAGAGSAAHLNGERFRMATGTQVQHVPYKGGPEGLAAVMAGDCDFYFIPLPAPAGSSQAASSRSSRCPARRGRRSFRTSRPRSRRDFRTRNTTSGSASGPRRARRRPSSIGSTPKPSRRCRILRPRPSSPRAAAIRCRCSPPRSTAS